LIFIIFSYEKNSYIMMYCILIDSKITITRHNILSCNYQKKLCYIFFMEYKFMISWYRTLQIHYFTFCYDIFRLFVDFLQFWEIPIYILKNVYFYFTTQKPMTKWLSPTLNTYFMHTKRPEKKCFQFILIPYKVCCTFLYIYIITNNTSFYLLIYDFFNNFYHAK